MGFAGVAVVVAAGRPSQSSACDESQTASHGAIRALPRNVPLPRERESLGAAEQGAPPPGGAVALARSCCSRIGGNNLPRGMLPACAYFDMVGADGAVCAVGARGVSLVPAWEGRGGASSGERGTLALFQGHEYREEYQESSCRQQGNASSGKKASTAPLGKPKSNLRKEEWGGKSRTQEASKSLATIYLQFLSVDDHLSPCMAVWRFFLRCPVTGSITTYLRS
ncbi:unnamed protein product [Closterium sp. NIES-53]